MYTLHSGDKMRRTQIYLQESTFQVFFELRRQRKQSIASIIRDVLSRTLLAQGSDEQEAELMSLSNLKLSGGPRDL